MKKLISIVTPAFNEEGNVEELISRVRMVFESQLPEYDYEHIVIDNASSDQTAAIVKRLCASDKRIKLIVNSRNFGHIRSPVHAMKQARGDAVFSLVSDLQDPPELIAEFVRIWEKGEHQMVLGIKKTSAESPVFFFVRKMYYALVTKLSEVQLVKNFTGFGLYDRRVIDAIRSIDDAYPYWRGLICEVGFSKYLYPYDQPVRSRGITKNNFYTLYDIGMLGITTHSKLPLRICTIFGFMASLLSLLIAVVYLIVKILHWDEMSLGVAPLVIGMFFFGSIQLMVIGFLGEYVGNIHTQTLKRPLVVELERVNFE
jgi:glycosyltransferase involved in cell wall biosynthesis